MLTERERKTLGAWRDLDEDHFLPFDAVARRSGMDRSLVRRHVRALARKGMVEFAKGLWTYDGEMAGAGYGLTEAGRRALAEREGERHGG